MSLDGFKPSSIYKKERRAIEPKILPCANCGSTKHIKHYMSYRTDYGEMTYKYPYIPNKKLYAAVKFAANKIRENGYFHKAVSTAL